MPVTRADASLAWRVLRLIAPLLMASAAVAVLAPEASAAPRQVSDRTWQANGRVRAITYRGDIAYLGGDFTRVISPDGSRSVVRNHAAAFNVETGELKRWNPNVGGSVAALKVGPGGDKVYLGGDFHRVGDKTRHYLAAVGTGHGTPTNWNPSPSGRVRSMSLWKGGKRLFIGGTFTKVNGHARLHLAKLYTGKPAVVKDWHPRVTQISEPPIADTCRPRCPANVTALALSRNGAGLYLGGTFGLVNNVSRNSVAQVDLDDGHTMPWNPDVYSSGSYNQVWDLAPYSSRVLICGNFWQVGGRRSPNMAVVDATRGARDPVFVGSTDGGIPACTASKDGDTLYVGGHFGLAGGPFAKETGQRRLHLAAFSGRTGALLAWNPKANSPQGVFAMARTDHRLAVGGDFTETGGRRQARFAQFSGSV